jgi:hypothetical protein
MTKIAAVILIVLGTLAIVYQGFTYTQTKQDAKIGPLTIQHNQTEVVPLPPIIGGVMIACGIGLFAVGATRSGV